MPETESTDPHAHSESLGPAAAVLAHVHVTWEGGAADAALLHAASALLVLEATEPTLVLPPIGTPIALQGDSPEATGHLAEHGRAGRFLVALGDRCVRRSLRLRVSLPGKLRGGAVTEWADVELADLTTGGARIRGVELPVGTQVTLAFTPPGRTEPVSVRALVAHGTHGAVRPWIGVAFRLVAMRGGR